MGFFNALEKIFNGTEDFMIAVGNQHAKQIDRMTDEEIEKRFSKPAEEIRMKAETINQQRARVAISYSSCNNNLFSERWNDGVTP